MTIDRWRVALDEFEVTLDASRTVLAGGPVGAERTFLPPPGLGPLPVELLPRAEKLAQACAQLTAELVAARDRAFEGLAQLAQADPPPAPSFVDARA